MGVPVDNYESFVFHYEQAINKSDLFAFFLYSSRSSHAHAAKFAKTHQVFFDELAVSQSMYLYFFVLNGKNAFFNPASKISASFGIPFAKLPGILIFGNSPSDSKRGIFFPIHNNLFKEPDRAETRLAKLFDKIGELRNKSQNSEQIIDGLSTAVGKWEKNEQMRPFWDYAGRQSHRLVNLPSDIVKKLAEGFAKGLIGNVT